MSKRLTAVEADRRIGMLHRVYAEGYISEAGLRAMERAIKARLNQNS